MTTRGPLYTCLVCLLAVGLPDAAFDSTSVLVVFDFSMLPVGLVISAWFGLQSLYHSYS